MQHFVTMPGVVNADQVIVQSEQMKQAYVDYLTDWAGEETRDIWKEKIYNLSNSIKKCLRINRVSFWHGFICFLFQQYKQEQLLHNNPFQIEEIHL